MPVYSFFNVYSSLAKYSCSVFTSLFFSFAANAEKSIDRTFGEVSIGVGVGVGVKVWVGVREGISSVCVDKDDNIAINMYRNGTVRTPKCTFSARWARISF